MTDIRVTIDCDGEYCGKCHYLVDDGLQAFCREFDYKDVMPDRDQKWKRCQQCLESEIKD